MYYFKRKKVYHIAFLVLSILTVSFTKVSSQETKSFPEVDEYKKIVDKNQETGNFNEAAKYLNKIAYLYWDKQLLNESIEYFEKSLEITKKTGNKNSIATVNSNIGILYSDLKNDKTALPYFEKSYEVRKEMKDKQGAVSQLINIGLTLQNLKNYALSSEKLEDALQQAKELNNIGLTKNCYSILAENYDKTGNSTKSFEYFNYFRALEKQDQKEEIKKTKEEIDKLSEKNQKSEQIRKLDEKELVEKDKILESEEEIVKETEIVNQKRGLEIGLLNKNKELQEASIHEKDKLIHAGKITLYLIIASSILLAGLAVVSFISFKQKAKANKLLQTQSEEIKAKSTELEKAFTQINEKNLKITSSITYAQRIQEAMLPNSEDLKIHFPKSFILFKPRDIVSGDFYWFGLAKNQEADSIIAACDCTGHGVPGAFMSMIGFNLLNEISQRGIDEPNQILEELHIGVRNALNQHSNENRDGMDAAICRYNATNKILTVSGAKNPVYYIQDNILTEIKGDVHPIGGIQKESKRIFTKHQILIDKPTSIYLLSDGYPDQFGGLEGRKFMYRNLKERLVEIHSKPMETQKEILTELMEKWQDGKHKQIDDMLIIGFEIG